MQIKPEQLKAHLKARSDKGLLPIYMVTGDEPLLVQEACDAIRAAARQAGCAEREVHHVEKGFDWQEFLQAGDAMSLFSERKLVELRLPTAKPGDAGGKALVAYADRLPEEDILLIQAGKVEAASRKTKWYKALDKAGAIIQVWPVDVRQMPGWAMRRMREKGLQPTSEAVALLVERVEGNLLACSQEIEKLLLLHGVGPLDVDVVASSVADSSRFDIFKLVDGALAGDAARTSRIVYGLKGEGVEPVLVLWALTREIRTLASMAFELRQGNNIGQVLAKYRVWDNRKPLIQKGLKCHSLAQWQMMLRQAGAIDAMVKGRKTGNVWDELLQLSLWLGGLQLHPRQQAAV